MWEMGLRIGRSSTCKKRDSKISGEILKFPPALNWYTVSEPAGAELVYGFRAGGRDPGEGDF